MTSSPPYLPSHSAPIRLSFFLRVTICHLLHYSLYLPVCVEIAFPPLFVSSLLFAIHLFTSAIRYPLPPARRSLYEVHVFSLAPHIRMYYRYLMYACLWTVILLLFDGSELC